MKLCDDCLRNITFNLNQNEVLVLQKMRELHIETPQLSADESKLISLVKGLSPYKIKYIIQRFLVTSLIDSTKCGITKYYLTENGKRLVELYLEDTKRMMSGNK